MTKPIACAGLLLMVGVAGCSTEACPEGQALREERDSDGQLVARGCVSPDSEGNEHRQGLWAAWHSNGQKSFEGPYVDGKRHGQTKAWYANGRLLTEGNYVEGEKEGAWTQWYPNGQKEFEVTFKEGQLDGSAVSWYEDGTFRRKVLYTDGQRVLAPGGDQFGLGINGIAHPSGGRPWAGIQHGPIRISPPVSRISPGPLSVVGELDQEVVAQIIRRFQNQIRTCYERELTKDPSLAGGVSLTFTIAPNGAVHEAAVKKDDVGADGAVGRCLTQRIRRWRFPEPKEGGQVVVESSWTFLPKDD